MFRRNIADAEQTRALLEEATGLGAAHAVRCVDVEGGTVNRLRDALAAMPSAQAVCGAEDSGASGVSGASGARKDRIGATAKKVQKSRSLAQKHGELVARAVKAFGFNTTLAPVVDLVLPESVEVGMPTETIPLCRVRRSSRRAEAEARDVRR